MRCVLSVVSADDAVCNTQPQCPWFYVPSWEMKIEKRGKSVKPPSPPTPQKALPSNTPMRQRTWNRDGWHYVRVRLWVCVCQLSYLLLECCWCRRRANWKSGPLWHTHTTTVYDCITLLTRICARMYRKKHIAVWLWCVHGPPPSANGLWKWQREFKQPKSRRPLASCEKCSEYVLNEPSMPMNIIDELRSN